MNLANPEIGSAPGWPLVLYFHHVSPTLQHYTSLTPDEFRRGLGLVLEQVGPAIEPAAVAPGFQPPGHPSVLLTFDDGYRDNLVHAAGILDEFDVRVILFCITDSIGGSAANLPSHRRDYLSWADCAEFAGRGHVLAAHSRTHPDLTAITAERARTEVTDSIATIATVTGRAPATFAYPYGRIPDHPVVPRSMLAFGTVKSPPAPWSQAPHSIRRTYLPSQDAGNWQALTTEWRRQCLASR
ncbi:polysaccharide deacetylase family protein [Nocardia sp. NPDC052566]|uniref:polysaccharide deacetylase family protein n=1 Tax=Nocardia sp. NPDC052566 TaxID=3364330 RepID=UPI0037CBF49B